MIEDGANGYLLSPNPEADETAKAIECFYFADREAKDRMRQNAYTEWSQKYNAAENAVKLCRELAELTGE